MERTKSPEGGVLAGKTAIVTGGASGIGKAIVMEFIKEGAKVMIFDVNDPDPELQEILENGQCGFFKGDVTDRQAIQKLIAETEDRFGPISILVNNAAIDIKNSEITTVTPEVWAQTLNVNLTGPQNMTQEVSRRMITQGTKGSIIFITSIHTLQAFIGDAPYDAAKGGVVTYMKNAALELGEYGIRSNAIAPGLIVDTGMSKAEEIGEELLQKSIDATPLKRTGFPEDIAHVAAFFASDNSDFITGQELRVDGGVSIKSPLPF